ncbi:hypothetical protein BCR43DRAFT_498130 [Syncephalastrum racemosum]|uniref:Myb-like domain-containing protein n=1 Tax=Syncephalastrum racemosum TaxID=13706 RepID=A0A1X2H3C4_SYNRA|nr:hypothetical protein BCR43DRAFT_498130 [Syncephalastrum racemosum]
MSSLTRMKPMTDDPERAKLWLIVGAYMAGATEKRVARLVGLNRQAVRRIYENYRQTGIPEQPKRIPARVKAKPVVEYDEHGNLIDDSGDEAMTSDEQQQQHHKKSDHSLRRLPTTKERIAFANERIEDTALSISSTSSAASFSSSSSSASASADESTASHDTNSKSANKKILREPTAAEIRAYVDQELVDRTGDWHLGLMRSPMLSIASSDDIPPPPLLVPQSLPSDTSSNNSNSPNNLRPWTPPRDSVMDIDSSKSGPDAQSSSKLPPPSSTSFMPSPTVAPPSPPHSSTTRRDSCCSSVARGIRSTDKYDDVIRGFEKWTHEDDMVLLKHVMVPLQEGRWSELEEKFGGRHLAHLCKDRWEFLQSQMVKGLRKM